MFKKILRKFNRDFSKCFVDQRDNINISTDVPYLINIY